METKRGSCSRSFRLLAAGLGDFDTLFVHLTEALWGSLGRRLNQLGYDGLPFLHFRYADIEGAVRMHGLGPADDLARRTKLNLIFVVCGLAVCGLRELSRCGSGSHSNRVNGRNR